MTRQLVQTYFRPLGLLFGPDARSLISGGLAGSLGGHETIGFTQVEKITRDGKSIARSFHSYGEFKDQPIAGFIAKPRPAFAGLVLTRPLLMGVVNVTPDSFSDGGQHAEAKSAIAHGLRLSGDGADILDVGGESTRPGSDEVLLESERERIMPVIAALAKDHVVSVDTRKPPLMKEAAEHGVRIINDVSALGFDPESAKAVSELGLSVILMHAQGEPRTMQLSPKYHDVALDVYDWLSLRIDQAVAAGIPKSRICIDPGIGFGKTISHNLELLRQLTLFHGLGVALLVGLSRKNFVGVLSGEKSAAKRVSGSVGGALQAAMMGAHILRVHDVKATSDAIAVFRAALDPGLAAV